MCKFSLPQYAVNGEGDGNLTTCNLYRGPAKDQVPGISSWEVIKGLGYLIGRGSNSGESFKQLLP